MNFRCYLTCHKCLHYPFPEARYCNNSGCFRELKLSVQSWSIPIYSSKTFPTNQGTIWHACFALALPTVSICWRNRGHFFSIPVIHPLCWSLAVASIRGSVRDRFSILKSSVLDSWRQTVWVRFPLAAEELNVLCLLDWLMIDGKLLEVDLFPSSLGLHRLWLETFSGFRCL